MHNRLSWSMRLYLAKTWWFEAMSLPQHRLPLLLLWYDGTRKSNLRAKGDPCWWAWVRALAEMGRWTSMHDWCEIWRLHTPWYPRWVWRDWLREAGGSCGSFQMQTEWWWLSGLGCSQCDPLSNYNHWSLLGNLENPASLASLLCLCHVPLSWVTQSDRVFIKGIYPWKRPRPSHPYSGFDPIGYIS